jgi:hypothetical protein
MRALGGSIQQVTVISPDAYRCATHHVTLTDRTEAGAPRVAECDVRPHRRVVLNLPTQPVTEHDRHILGSLLPVSRGEQE